MLFFLRIVAVMVGTQMFIMYGQTGPSSLDNGVYALDTTSWAWQTSYTPNNLEYTNTGLLPAPAPGSGAPSTQNSGSGTDSGGGKGSNGSGGSSGSGSGGAGNNNGGGGSSKAPTGAIIGGSIGGVALVLILAALGAFAWTRSRRRKGEAQMASLYPANESEAHRTYFANNMYDSAPPYYQHAAPWASGSNGNKTSLSTQGNSSGEFASNPLDGVAQKPNTPAEFQKPNAGE
jgi:hypothetical protein